MINYFILFMTLISIAYADDTCPRYYVEGDPGVYRFDHYEQDYERFTGDSTRILRKMNQCELFPGAYAEEHSRGRYGESRPLGLSLFWAQEYTGADLLYKRINAYRPVLCPDSNLLEIWDDFGFHGNGVSAHIMSDVGGGIIPKRKECKFKIPRDSAGYKRLIGSLKSKQEKCSKDPSKCTKYINASLKLAQFGKIQTTKSELKALKDFTSRTPSVLVLAAGNNPIPTTKGANELGKEKRAIVVSAIDEDGAPSYTSYGEGLTISAPSNHFTVTPTGRKVNHTYYGGTSGATPQVTGTLAAFTLITGYPLSTKESAILLEKTAIKYTRTPEPNMIGKGMLNSYQIGEIAFKLKEKCKGDKDCIKRSLEDESSYTGNGKDDKLKEISKYYPGYPSCSGEVGPNEKISCTYRRRFVEQLRKEAFLSKSPEHWKALSCISKLDGKVKNAQYYEKLAKRYSFDNEEKFLDHLIATGYHKGISKYVLTHPKWRKHRKYSKWLKEINLSYSSRNPVVQRDIVDEDKIKQLFASKNYSEIFDPLKSFIKTNPKFFKEHFLKLIKNFKPKSDEELIIYDEIVSYLSDSPDVAKIINVPKIVSDLLKDREQHTRIVVNILQNPKWIDSPHSDKWMGKIIDNMPSKSEYNSISDEIFRLRKQLKEESIRIISVAREKELKEKIKEKERQINSFTSSAPILRALEDKKWQNKQSYQKNLIKVLEKTKVSGGNVIEYRNLIRKIKNPENVREFIGKFMSEVTAYVSSSFDRETLKDKRKLDRELYFRKITIRYLESIRGRQWKEDRNFQEKLRLVKEEFEKIKARYK